MASKTSSANGMSEDKKTLITILLLVFLPIVGVIVMWVWTKWQTWVKVLITLVGLIYGFIVGMTILAVGVLTLVNPQEQLLRAKCIEECGETSTECVQACIQNGVLEENSTYPQVSSPLENIQY